MALRDLGLLERAASSLRAALGLRPQFAEALNALGTTLHEMGRLDEAAESLRSALRLRPDYAEAHFNLHYVVLDTEGLDAAIGCLRRAVECLPADTAFRFFLGALLEHSGDPVRAAAHLAPLSGASRADQARLDAWRYIRSAAGGKAVLIGSPCAHSRSACGRRRRPASCWSSACATAHPSGRSLRWPR